jgi:ABC-type nitrate/sulfonate/bicarbonate transport system substrate-binding protein
LLALALAGGRFSSAIAGDAIEFNAGIADPVNTVLAMWVAQDAGLYAQNGLNVHIVNMNGGSHGAEELQAGRLDVMHVGLSSVVKINRAGGNLRLIGSLSNVIRFTFFSSSAVKTAADLKGGLVGVSTFGSESDSTVTLALQRLGLARNDVKIAEFGGGSHRLAAIKSGEISATALNEPFSSLAREEGVNVLVDLVPEQIPWLFSGITTERSSIQTRRESLARFLKATIEGNYLALSNETMAKQILAKELKISDPKILDISYNDFKQQSPLNLEPSPQAAKNILAQFPGGSMSVEDYVDTSILDELKGDGFFQAMENKYGKP